VVMVTVGRLVNFLELFFWEVLLFTDKKFQKQIVINNISFI
jgi:hypothetical protein